MLLAHILEYGQEQNVPCCGRWGKPGPQKVWEKEGGAVFPRAALSQSEADDWPTAIC
jgi:hypothetical protein